VKKEGDDIFLHLLLVNKSTGKEKKKGEKKKRRRGGKRDPFGALFVPVSYWGGKKETGRGVKRKKGRRENGRTRAAALHPAFSTEKRKKGKGKKKKSQKGERGTAG